LAVLVFGLVATVTAQAHVTGALHAHAFTDGLLHPITGLDHLITALGMGWLAVKHARPAISRGAFLGTIALGLWLAGQWVIPASIIDTAILLSLGCIGLVLLRKPAAMQPALMIMAPLFGLLYGYAHGSALPAGQAAYGFVAGMLVTTVSLLALGGYAASLYGKNRQTAGLA